MCGIAGLLQRDATVDPEVIVRMRDALTHRGPDDAGTYISPDAHVALGHRRLSIIDLSPAGHQPMSNEDGTVWTVFNGEIYNFAGLRAQLEQRGHRFQSHTDTEVIVHAYEEFGEGCVQYFRGMFAFAIWDERTRQLMLARDRFGIKPLYYFADGNRLAFASELKAITANPEIARVPDQSSIYDYLTYRYVPTPKTIYRQIFKLPPAHVLVAGFGPAGVKTRMKRYWEIEFAPEEAPDWQERLQRALTDAVRNHLVSDVPLGVLLSGGIDSSAVVALLRRGLGKSVESFTAGFDVAEHSEAPYARRVAEVLGTHHHETTVSLGTLDEALDRVVGLYDEPFADGSAVPTHRVCEFARQHVKVALSGDGGDELFAGYSWYWHWLKLRKWDRFWNLLPGATRDWVQRNAPAAWKTRNFGRRLLLNPLEQYLRQVGVFTRYEKQRLLSREFLEPFKEYDDVWQIRQFWRENLDPLDAMEYVDLHTYLPDDILTKVDRASMAVSLELRVPLLDDSFAEMAVCLPGRLRCQNGVTKHPLKRMLEQWLPNEIIHRPKQGFSSPWGKWLQPELVRRRLKDGALVRGGVLNGSALARLDHRYFAGGKAWALLVLNQWFERKA